MQKINVLGVLFILALMVQCKEDKKSVDKDESSAPMTEVAESVDRKTGKYKGTGWHGMDSRG